MKPIGVGLINHILNNIPTKETRKECYRKAVLHMPRLLCVVEESYIRAYRNIRDFI